MKQRPSGTVYQGGLAISPRNYGHLNVTELVLGVILNVYKADSIFNETTGSYQDGISPFCAAKVLVLNSGTDTPMILPTVTIVPKGSTGHDDYYEELPKGTTGTIDGSAINTNFTDLPPHLLNGDRCLVGFIGGSVHQPVMLSWFPHPENRKSATTEGTGVGTLEQGRRVVRRFQGTRMGITSEGTVHLDTSKANYKLNTDRTTRTETPVGGDVKVFIKSDRNLNIDFNKPVIETKADGSPAEPDFLWERDEIDAKKSAETVATRLLMDKNFIRALAGEVVQIAAAQKVYIGQETASENFVLGQELKTLLTSILNALITHVHPIAPGIVVSAVPLDPAPVAITAAGVTLPSTEAATWSDNLSDVSAETILSTWIFGQKDPT